MPYLMNRQRPHQALIRVGTDDPAYVDSRQLSAAFHEAPRRSQLVAGAYASKALRRRDSADSLIVTKLDYENGALSRSAP